MSNKRHKPDGIVTKLRQVETLPPSRASSTDMGNVSHLVPSIHPMIAAVPAGIAFHTEAFTHWAGTEMGMRATLDGVKAMAMTAVDFLTDATLRASVKSLFAEAMAA